MNATRSERGFSIIEVLVTMAVFAVVSIGMYQVLFHGARSSDATEDVARASEEARLGLNRMIRDTREGQLFSSLQPNSYNVRIDFDADGTYENPNDAGDFENLTYRFDASGRRILLNGEVLVRDVEPVPGSSVFSYSSSDLRYDWNGDGTTTPEELDQAPAFGHADVSAADTELYTNVQFAIRIRIGQRVADFFGEAQLRNRR